MSFVWFSTSTLLYLFFTYVRLNFFNIKSFLTSKDFMVKSNLLSTNTYTNLYKFYTILLLITLIFIQQYVQYSELFTNFLTINLNFLSVGILFLLFIVLTLNINSAHAHHAPLVLIFTILSLLALSVSNLYQLYLIFELTAYTNLLFLSTYRLSTFDKNRQHLIATIISFVLNFIASILFFAFMVLITWVYTYPTWTSLVLFNANGIISVVLTVGILVKLGVGPWLSGNYHTYAGYNLLYLIVYTINIVLIITPILLWLYLNFGNSIILVLSLISLILYISGTLHTVKSVKSLFAYSTVIVYFYLFLICLV